MKWPHIATMYEMPRPIHKFTRSRKQHPNRDSALKMIYMGVSDASKRWTKALRNWKETLNHFAITFKDRMPRDLT